MVEKKNLKLKFLNQLMINGKKHKSEIEFLKCFKHLQKSQHKKCSLDVFKLSLKNSSPFFRLKSIKSKTRKNVMEIPYLLNEKLRVFYGIKNILGSANSLKKVSFYKRLNDEFLMSSNLKGKSVKNRRKLHEDSFLQRKYARYRWF